MYASVGKTADDEDLIAQILAAAPGNCASVLTTEQSIIESKGKKLTPEKLIKAMQKQFRIANKKGKRDETESDDYDKNEAKSEAALLNVKDGQRKFNGHCNECGQYGHKRVDCWELEKNKHLRPKWWKSKKNEDEVSGVELCLANLTHGLDFGSAY